MFGFSNTLASAASRMVENALTYPFLMGFGAPFNFFIMCIYMVTPPP